MSDDEEKQCQKVDPQSTNDTNDDDIMVDVGKKKIHVNLDLPEWITIGTIALIATYVMGVTV